MLKYTGNRGYFQHLQKGRDVFSKFGVYFDNIENMSAVLKNCFKVF
jgi:hypothetical protein